MTVQDIALALKGLRKLKGLTQVQLSEMTKIPVRTIKYFESGKNSSLDVFCKILNALDYTITIDKLPDRDNLK